MERHEKDCPGLPQYKGICNCKYGYASKTSKEEFLKNENASLRNTLKLVRTALFMLWDKNSHSERCFLNSDLCRNESPEYCDCGASSKGRIIVEALSCSDWVGD